MKDSHKNLCVRGFKKYQDLTKQAKDILKDYGHDLDRICLKKCSSLKEFYDDNDVIFQDIKDSNFMVIHDGTSRNLPDPGSLVNLGQVFKMYINCKTYNVKAMGKIARHAESYHGLQLALEAHLEAIMMLQPDRMYFRALVPLLFIQLGQDDEAYNFIKVKFEEGGTS